MIHTQSWQQKQKSFSLCWWKDKHNFCAILHLQYLLKLVTFQHWSLKQIHTSCNFVVPLILFWNFVNDKGGMWNDVCLNLPNIVRHLYHNIQLPSHVWWCVKQLCFDIMILKITIFSIQASTSNDIFWYESLIWIIRIWNRLIHNDCKEVHIVNISLHQSTIRNDWWWHITISYKRRKNISCTMSLLM